MTETISLSVITMGVLNMGVWGYLFSDFMQSYFRSKEKPFASALGVLAFTCFALYFQNVFFTLGAAFLEPVGTTYFALLVTQVITLAAGVLVMGEVKK
jgi:hypothetical protein